MTDINWYAAGTVACIIIYGTLVIAACRKSILAGIRRMWETSRSVQAVLAVLVVVATVEAQKQGGTNTMQQLGGMFGMAYVPSGATVDEEDVARGYRLDYVTNDFSRSCAMPTNALYLGNVHARGASSDFGRNVIDFGDWSFPAGTNGEASSTWWWMLGGRIRPTPHDAGGEISVGAGNVSAAQGESAVWWATADGGERVVGWQNVYPGGNTNAAANLQIVLKPNGGFEVWSNEVGTVYARIDANDWDGDGLGNEIDASPLTNDGDLFGTGTSWLNANCGNVLTASDDGMGGSTVEWHSDVNTNAYYWLGFTALADGTRVTFTCDGPSTLGNMVVIAKENQQCRVPLLMGASYSVQANHPIGSISSSDMNADVPSEQSAGFLVERPVSLAMDTTLGMLTSTPNVGAAIGAITGECSCITYEGCLFDLTSDPGCGCDCGTHLWQVTATWEGYGKSFGWQAACECRDESVEYPESLIGLSASSVVMRGGNMGAVAARFNPGQSPDLYSATLNVSGGEKVALWSDTNKTGAVSLPLMLTPGQSVSFFVEGISGSGSVGDVVFTLEYGEDTITRTMTVAYVEELDVTSDVAGTSPNPPPFDGETDCPFSVTNSPSPDRHLVVPFCAVANQDLSVRDFTVYMNLALRPFGVNASRLRCDWEIVESLPQMSGSLVSLNGPTALFLNPKRGGVYRFRGRCGGSPWTEANVVLPLAGASVDSVIAADVQTATTVAQYLESHYTTIERQLPTWGLDLFYYDGMGDYGGRVDNATWRTVWCYNQVNEETGMGAVATLNGVPTRMSKMSNFLVAYTAKASGVWSTMLWLSSLGYGTWDDTTASLSWNAGQDLAENGGSLASILPNLAHGMWTEADDKERNLWPNSQPADNQASTPYGINYNYNFISPGCVLIGRDGSLE